MHPILTEGRRLVLYLVAWLPVAALVAALVVFQAGAEWLPAIAFALPLSLIYAFVCLAAWYPCRSAPLGSAGPLRLLGTQAAAAAVSGSLWLLLAAGWATLLARIRPAAAVDFPRLAPALLAVALLLYLLAVAGSYLLMAFEASKSARAQALEMQVRARDAELAALKAQREHELAERELELARSIQQRLLPPATIDGEGFRLAARNLPARYVAGDFYDVFRIADGRLGLVVADVAGKGMGASLIMASVKAMLPLVAEGRTAAGTLVELNRRLTGELTGREFVALSFALFDPRDGRLGLTNAGLPDPYLLRGGQTAPLALPGPRLPLGVRSELAYEVLDLALEPGDRVLWLTDGLPESPTDGGDPLGYAELVRLLPTGARDPDSFLDQLFTAVREATRGGLEDDWTALMLERPG